MLHALASVPIAIRIVRTSHGFVCLRVVQQPVAFGNNTLSPGSDQSGGTGEHGFGPLGFVAHNPYGLSQRWRLFLDAAGIRQYEPGRISIAINVTYSIG